MTAPAPEGGPRRPGWSTGNIVIGIIVVILILLAIWWFVGRGDTTVPADADVTSQPTVETPATETPAETPPAEAPAQ